MAHPCRPGKRGTRREIRSAYNVGEITALFGIPVTMTIAILKYRLYDIDRIISRTLAYAIITGVLVGLYASPGALMPAGLVLWVPKS